MAKAVQHGLAIGLLFCSVGATAQWAQLSVPTQNWPIASLIASPNGHVVAAGVDWSRSVDAGQTWSDFTPQDNFGNPLPMAVGQITPTHPDTIIAAGAMNALDQFIIQRTTNDGNTWTVPYVLNDGFPSMFKRVHFHSPLIGVAGGSDGHVVRTTDGGATWSATTPVSALGINGICSFSGNVIVAIGTNQAYRSTDNGTTWLASGSLGLVLTCLHEVDDVMFVGGSGRVYVSYNTGLNWGWIDGPFGDVNDVFALNQDTIYVATDDGLYRTMDGGQFWDVFADLAGIPIEQVEFADDLVGYCSSGTTVYKTTNGGGPAGAVSILSATVANSQCGSRIVSFYNDSPGALDAWWLLDGQPYSMSDDTLLTLTAPSTVVNMALVVSNGQDTDTAYWTQTVTVDQPITVNAGPDVVLCVGDTTQFLAAGANSYTWTGTLFGPNNVADPLVWGTPQQYVVTGAAGACTDKDTVLTLLPPPPSLGNWSTLFTVSSPSSMLGISGFSRTCAAGYSYTQYSYTVDGGATVEQSQPLQIGSMNMLTPFVGFGLGMDIGLNSEWSVYKTTDAWRTSVELTPDTGLGNCELKMFSETIGYIKHPTGLFRTVDGGAHWDRITNSAWYVDGVVYTEHPDTMILVMWDHSRTTTDGGATWDSVPLPIPFGGNVACFDATYNGRIYASHDGNSNLLWHTDDTGASWEFEEVFENDIYEMMFLPGGTGYLLADGGNLHVTMTEDNGDCFIELGMNTGWPGGYGSLAKSSHGLGFRSGHFQQNVRSLQVLEPPTPLPPLLDFGVNDHSLCDNRPLQVWNASEGYTDFNWYLNGAFVSNSIVPALDTLGAGAYVLQLIGMLGLDPDTVVHAFTVHDAPSVAPPAPVALSLNCIDQDSLLVATAGVPGAQSYLWWAGGDAWVEHVTDGDTAVLRQLREYNHPFAEGYWSTGVAVVDQYGCIGPWSDTLVIGYSQSALPAPSVLTAPAEVCIVPGQPAVTQVHCSPVAGASGYDWSMSGSFPPGGYVVGNDTNATIYWDGSVYDQFRGVRVSARDTCGGGAANSEGIYLDESPVITQQPLDAVATENDPLVQFSFAWNMGPLNAIEWYHDGSVVPGMTATTLQITNVEPTDEGWYWATGQVNGCDGFVPFTTDSAYLEVIELMFPVATISGPDSICAGVQVPFSGSATNGPTSWSWQFPGGQPPASTMQSPNVTYQLAGTYPVYLTASNQDGTGPQDTTTIVVASCVGIGELGAPVVSVFPNPASDVLNVVAEGVFDAALWDMQGRELVSSTGNLGRTELDVSGTSPGHYLLSIEIHHRTVHLPVQVRK